MAYSLLLEEFDFVREGGHIYFINVIDNSYEIRIENMFDSVFVGVYKDQKLLGTKTNIPLSASSCVKDIWNDVSDAYNDCLNYIFFQKSKVIH